MKVWNTSTWSQQRLAKDRINWDELADKLVERAAEAEDPLRTMAELLTDFVMEAEVTAKVGAEADLEQVLVTEYAPGAPIGWHKDRPVFDDVTGLSLASACNFRLRRLLSNGKWERTSVRLEPRSAYFLSGPARWEWEHSIPPLEQLRYSLTFRNRPEAGLPHRTDRPTIDHELSRA